MIVSVQNSDVKIGKKALSGVKSVTKKSKKQKKDQKQKSESKPKPAVDESVLKKIREQRDQLNKQKNERWAQVIVQVAKRSDLSDVHKEMLQKLLEPQYIRNVPRKHTKGFKNFMILSCKFEVKHSDAAVKLFSILKTAEGSTPHSVKRKENRLKKALKKKATKQLKKDSTTLTEKPKKMEKSKKMEVVLSNEDVEMDSVKDEVKAEQDNESSDNNDSNATEGLVVRGRSKKNRKNLEKVGKKVVHLAKKLPKNIKGKGKNNKKNRKK